MNRIWLPIFIAVLFYACSNTTNETRDTEPSVSSAPAFSLEGLWSRDSAGYLTNRGYLFNPAGDFQEVASSGSGSWELNAADSLVLTENEKSYSLLIEKQDADHIRLKAVNDGMTSLYRRVPFGMKDQPDILTGYSGSLSKLMPERTYTLNIPSTKMVEVLMQCEDTLAGFMILDDNHVLTPRPVQRWKSVIINGGAYRLKLMHAKPGKLTDQGVEYDVKLMTY